MRTRSGPDARADSRIVAAARNKQLSSATVRRPSDRRPAVRKRLSAPDRGARWGVHHVRSGVATGAERPSGSASAMGRAVHRSQDASECVSMGGVLDPERATTTVGDITTKFGIRSSSSCATGTATTIDNVGGNESPIAPYAPAPGGYRSWSCIGGQASSCARQVGRPICAPRADNTRHSNEYAPGHRTKRRSRRTRRPRPLRHHGRGQVAPTSGTSAPAEISGGGAARRRQFRAAVGDGHGCIRVGDPKRPCGATAPAKQSVKLASVTLHEDCKVSLASQVALGSTETTRHQRVA